MTICEGYLNGITVYLTLERLQGLKIGGVLFHNFTVPTIGSCTLGQGDLLSLCVGTSSLGSISDQRRMKAGIQVDLKLRLHLVRLFAVELWIGGGWYIGHTR